MGIGVRKGSVTGRIETDNDTIRSGRISGMKNDGDDVQNVHVEAVKEDCDVSVGAWDG